MAGLPWTKYQDFYLRLGFLKVLVGALDPNRRSATNEAIYRRLRAPLFEDATRHSLLWKTVSEWPAWHEGSRGRGDQPTVAEALLVVGNSQSLLYAVTEPTVYKILDWGHDTGLVGRGNQITERGLLLRSLLPGASVENFLAGDVMAWNPFVLTNQERVLLTYHLGEIDGVTAELITDLGSCSGSMVLETLDAGRLTCRALFRVLDQARHELAPRDLPVFRVARDLACTIADELDMKELVADCAGSRTRRLPQAVKRAARRGSPGSPSKSSRKSRKNADHQTIPRFEQLIDLGFLVKSEPGGSADGRDLSARRKWRYLPTAAASVWAERKSKREPGESRFWWDGFAATIGAALDLAKTGKATPDYSVVGDYLWRAYTLIHRPIGHTPVDSLALLATVHSVVDGRPIEMVTFHRLLLEIKERNLIPGSAFFASGNSLDKMFVHLKPDFRERLPEAISGLRVLESQ